MIKPFLHTVAEDLWSRFGNGLRDVAVVFNNKRPMVFLKNHLSRVSGKTIWSPRMFTISEFFARSCGLVVAGEFPRFFLLWEAYNELLAAEGSTPVAAEQFLPMAEIILRDFDQIDYDLVDPKAIYMHLKDVALIRRQFENFTEEQQFFLSSFWSSFSAERQVAVEQKFIELWQRMPALYELLAVKMRAKGLTNTASLYRDLAEGRAAYPDFTDAFSQVAFVGFNALNKCEALLFKQWQTQGKALFYFDGDAYYMDDALQEAGHFLRKNILDHGLNHALGAFPAQLDRQDKTLNVYPVSGYVAQAKALAEHFKDPAGPARPSRQAVILANEQLLVPTLQSIPDPMQINVTMGYPLKQSPLFGLVHLWISVQEYMLRQGPDRVKIKDMLDYFGHPLTADPDEDLQAILAELQGHKSPELNIAPLRLPEEALLFFTFRKGAGPGIAALQEVLSRIVGRLEQEGRARLLESVLMLQLYQVLNQLKDNLCEVFPGDTGSGLSLSFLKRSLSGIAATLEGAPLEGLQIMGILESRCLDFEEVFILGANEGILPKPSLAPTFIPDSLRRAFGLPVVENLDALSAYLFYRLLQRSSRIHIVYNSLVDEHSSGELSRFVQQLKFESRIPVVFSPQRQQVSLAVPEGEKLIIEKSPEIMAILEQYLLPGKKTFSASALKLYLQCPLRFFFKYIAGFREPELPAGALDPAVMGNAFHTLMQRFYEPWLGGSEGPDRAGIFNRMDALPDLCREALSEALGLKEAALRHPDSEQIIALNILEENARLLLRYDALQVAPFRIHALENKKDYTRPFPIRVAGRERQVNLYAIIDRVDEVQGIKRIVDYKTGNDALAYKGVASLFAAGEPGNPAVFQALFYTWIYQEVHEDRTARPHLYILRKLQAEGSDFAGGEIQQLMKEFEIGLKGILEELFNPAIPFQHNDSSRYCERAPYAYLCGAGSQREEAGEET